MRYTIDMALFSTLPDYTRVVVVLRGLDSTRKVAASLNLLRKAEQAARVAFANADSTDEPHLAVWRRAYEVFGMGDEEHPSILEGLIRHAVAGQRLPDADPLTNLLRAFALQNRVPVGGDDLDRISGNVWLRPARSNEFFVPLNRRERPETPHIGEIITVDDASTVLCRRWNAWPSDFTKITPDTQNALLYLDVLPPVHPSQAEMLGEKLARLVRGFVGGEVALHVLSAKQPAVRIGMSDP